MNAVPDDVAIGDTFARVLAGLPAEERSAVARRREATKDPAQRRRDMRPAIKASLERRTPKKESVPRLTLTPAERSASARAREARRSPEARSESVRKGHANRTPEQREAAALRLNGKLGADVRGELPR